MWDIDHHWDGHIARAGKREEELAENPEGIDYFCERRYLYDTDVNAILSLLGELYQQRSTHTDMALFILGAYWC